MSTVQFPEHKLITLNYQLCSRVTLHWRESELSVTCDGWEAWQGGRWPERCPAPLSSTELHWAPGLEVSVRTMRWAPPVTTSPLLLSTPRMNFSLLLCFLASVPAQLKVNVSTSELSEPANSGENNENLREDFESEKLDHRRRRRRKMLPLSTAAPSLRLSGPTEPRITVSPVCDILTLSNMAWHDMRWHSKL